MIEHFIKRHAAIRNRRITGINLCAKADPSYLDAAFAL
jgi:hypothetical protein